MVERRHCTYCGAPLRLKVGQTLAAGADCNSTRRVAPGGTSWPAVTKLAAVPPDGMEDPCTGSVTGAMTAYLWRYGPLTSPRFVADQGQKMQRPGRPMWKS